MGLSLLTSVLTGSPRFLLAKDGLVTGAWGIWFLVSARGQRRPAALIFGRPLMEPMRLFAVRSWDLLWDAEPKFRRIWRVASVIWGMGPVIDATARVVISYTLPVGPVPAIGSLLYPVTFAVLQVAGNVYFHRAGLYRLLGARWLAPGPKAA
ncbi:MAG TPA: VC0807 family protein [Trebonia sp.]